MLDKLLLVEISLKSFLDDSGKIVNLSLACLFQQEQLKTKIYILAFTTKLFVKKLRGPAFKSLYKVGSLGVVMLVLGILNSVGNQRGVLGS